MHSFNLSRALQNPRENIVCITHLTAFRVCLTFSLRFTQEAALFAPFRFSLRQHVSVEPPETSPWRVHLKFRSADCVGTPPGPTTKWLPTKSCRREAEDVRDGDVVSWTFSLLLGWSFGNGDGLGPILSKRLATFQKRSVLKTIYRHSFWLIYYKWDLIQWSVWQLLSKSDTIPKYFKEKNETLLGLAKHEKFRTRETNSGGNKKNYNK